MKPVGAKQQNNSANVDMECGSDTVPSDSPREVTLDDLAEYLFLVSNKTFDEETARRQSMLDTSNRLLTCDSIISVALISILPIMLDQLPDGNELSSAVVIIFSFLALAFVIASLGVGVIAQYRFAYRALNTPRELEEGIRASAPRLKTKYQIAWQYSNTLDDVQTSLVRLNDRLGRCNKIALILLGIALSLAMLTGIIFLILYFV